MIAVQITLLARDPQEAVALNRDVEDSRLLNDWPVFAWHTRAATDTEVEWFKREYESSV